MEVQTPEYWKEEKFQPLIEETTAYGNKVKIPQSLKSTWEMWGQNKKKIDVERAKASGWFRKSLRNPIYQDLRRVYFEQYHK